MSSYKFKSRGSSNSVAWVLSGNSQYLVWYYSVGIYCWTGKIPKPNQDEKTENLRKHQALKPSNYQNWENWKSEKTSSSQTLKPSKFQNVKVSKSQNLKPSNYQNLSCLSLKQLTIPCLVLFCDDVVDLYLELIAHLVVEQMCFYTVCIQPREPQQPDCDGTNFSRFRKKILLCSG